MCQELETECIQDIQKQKAFLGEGTLSEIHHKERNGKMMPPFHQELFVHVQVNIYSIFIILILYLKLYMKRCSFQH